jgi:hypothetical protein
VLRAYSAWIGVRSQATNFGYHARGASVCGNVLGAVRCLASYSICILRLFVIVPIGLRVCRDGTECLFPAVDVL